MAQGFCQEDTTQIALVRELAEYGCRRTTHGKAKIDSIAQINSQCQTIDEEEYALTDLLVNVCLFLM